MSGFVLDNSVAMRWCLDSGTHAYADQILSRLETGNDTAFVPLLWRYEVSAVLARAELKGFLTARKSAEFLEDLAALPSTVDTDSAGRVLTDVHRFAVQYRLSSYDAAYLELASRLALPPATLDEELLVACKAAGIVVV